MTFFELITSFHPLVFSSIVIGASAIIVASLLFFASVDFSKEGIRFSKKGKNTGIKNAIIIEKIIETAIEINYIKTNKKLKKIMEYCENEFSEIINEYEKNFRSDLEDIIKQKDGLTDIAGLEEHNDLYSIKMNLKIIKDYWVDLSRTYFRSLFEKMESNNLDYERIKDDFIFSLISKRDETLNYYYKDDININRLILRTNVYYIMKRSDTAVNHKIKEIINKSKNIHMNLKIEEERKKKELEDFITENFN